MLHLHNLTEHLDYLTHLSYWQIFLVILASGHVVPLPEAVLLILLGYLSALGKAKLLAVIAVAIFTVIFMDLIIYSLSLGGSELAMKFSRSAGKMLKGRYERAEEKHLFMLVFFSHFIPGWRLANPIIAGVTQMPWRKFTLYTFISALVYGPLYVLIGYTFHTRITELVTAIESVHHLLLWVFLVGVIIFFIVYNTRSKQHAKE